jgi:GxxExxY protein
LESVYQAALAHDVNQSNIPFEKEKVTFVQYENIMLDIGFRCDFIIDKQVIVECKTIEKITPIDQPQLLNYLKAKGLSVGLLINFNVMVLKDGIRRMVNQYIE